MKQAMAKAEPDEFVRIDRVSKRFDDALAVDDVSLTINRGEIFALLGGSGSGKSTLLRILAGFERPSEGRVFLDGQDITDLPPYERPINMMFQSYALFPHMTVAQNISFGLELKGLGKAEIKQRLDEVMSFLELAPFATRYASQLSGGQRQRVALARALAPDPALLLLDEPLGALDAKLRGQVQMELKAIQRRTDKTFLFVTHDQDEALTMSDRIVVMNGGRIEQDGTAEDLYFHPQTRFVAEFIGATNLIDGTVRGLDGAAQEVVLDWRGIELRGQAPAGAPQTGQEVSASLRLEKIALGADRPATRNAVMGRIVEKTFLGSRVAVNIVVPEAGDALLRAYADSDVTARLGDAPVWLGWDSHALSVLRH